MTSIKDLQPAAIWQNFFLLTQVPRPSGHLEKIQKFLLDWAAERGIKAEQDEAGNIIMRKPASTGMENCKIVTVQAHMDMVPQKTATSPHDFETMPIETWIDGDWVKAKGTTLGADDGMGVATIMALMEDDSIPHGPLEGFITADEETTMYGVNHMKPTTLEGEILLNLDNETEGEMIIGSAGGVNLTATLDYQEVDTDATDAAVKITIGGLLGGHSGLEINEGRANANKMMARVVQDAVANFEARLALWTGGNMRNAIPRDAEVVLTLPKENVAELLDVVRGEWAETFKGEYGAIEADFTLVAQETATPAKLVPEEIQDALINALCACHNGVFRFIPDQPAIVETSSNLAIVTIGDGHAEFRVLIRSSRDSMRSCLAETLESAFAMAGMKVELSGEYPAWQPDLNSEIVKIMSETYTDLFAEKCSVQVIHAGLECGVIGACHPMDMVSFGPTLRSPHTPNERCFIPSVEKYWKFVLETLARTPKK